VDAARGDRLGRLAPRCEDEKNHRENIRREAAAHCVLLKVRYDLSVRGTNEQVEEWLREAKRVCAPHR
jgi:hypothetical protein